MNKPKRIQLSRKKGYRKPKGAVNVARPTKWGNPFKIGDDLLVIPVIVMNHLKLSDEVIEAGVIDREISVKAFRFWLKYHIRGIELVEKAKKELCGKDLACWCKPDEACHADALLEMANE